MAERRKFKPCLKFWLFYFSFFVLFSVLAVRMYYAFIDNIGIDFILFFSCTYAAVRGQDFFNVHNLVFYEWEELIMLPGLLLFFIPYMLFDIQAARLIYFLLGLGVTVFCYIYLFKLTGLLEKINFRSPNLNAFLFFGGLFALLNSSPQLMCLRNGQTVTWVMLLLVLFLSISNRYWRAVLFGFAAICKYSMLTFFAPLLFIKKQYFICFAAFAVFLLVCMWPGLIGYDLVELYTRYARMVLNTLDGCNSFQIAGQDILEFGFLRLKILNYLGKLFFAVAMLLIFWRERNRSGIGLNLLMLVFCLTMCVSYHRIYDNVILVLLLIIKTHFLIFKKDWINSLICGAFLGYFLVPISWIFKIADYLGNNVSGLQNFFYLSSYWHFSNVLPLVAFSHTALSIYLLYIYLKNDNDYIFELQSN